MTIRVGINSAHPETRVAMMPAFGRDAMLPEAQAASWRAVGMPDRRAARTTGPEAYPPTPSTNPG